MIKERKRAGRKKLAHDDERVLTAKRMHKNPGMSIEKICKLLKISRSSFYRYIAVTEAVS
jgi:DNA invertase Pin-like site-specific DNA recombinase